MEVRFAMSRTIVWSDSGGNMPRTAFAVAALAASMLGVADPVSVSRHVDLRDNKALVELERTNPRRYAQIQEIIAGLLADPRRAESGWLEASFDARDVDLEKLQFLTSYPPKQLLAFTVEDTRYTLHLVRTDLDAKAVPAN
jgi:hypothetical protein